MPTPATARLRILSDNGDAWVARWRALDAATESIDVQYFIVEPDAFGLSLLGVLYEKARAGVQVRLMVDSRGTFAVTRPYFGLNLLGQLVKAGAEVRVYNPLESQMGNAVASGDLRTLAASNHDKLIIVDHRVAITGGRNISKEYLVDPRDLPGAYIDMDVVVEGETAATALTEAFSSELKAKRAVRVTKSDNLASHDALLGAAQAMRLWLSDAPFNAAELTMAVEALVESDLKPPEDMPTLQVRVSELRAQPEGVQLDDRLERTGDLLQLTRHRLCRSRPHRARPQPGQ